MDDNETAAEYGREHPAVYGGLWVVGDRLQIGITANLDQHTAALRARLAHPDAIDVVPARWTQAHLESVLDEVGALTDAHPGAWFSRGLGRQVVLVDLRADGAALAGELHGRYADAVEVTVGGRPYPIVTGWGTPPQPPTAVGDLGTVDLYLRLDSDQVRSGADLRGTVFVHNTGTAAVAITGGTTLVASVLDDAGAVAGHQAGWLTSAGLHHHLDPDRIVELPVLLGTTGTLSYATPPGRYRVVVPVPVTAADGSRHRLLSPPVPLDVLP